MGGESVTTLPPWPPDSFSRSLPNPNYKLIQKPRAVSRGGGVGCFKKGMYSTRAVVSSEILTLENIVRSKNVSLAILCWLLAFITPNIA